MSVVPEGAKTVNLAAYSVRVAACWLPLCTAFAALLALLVPAAMFYGVQSEKTIVLTISTVGAQGAEYRAFSSLMTLSAYLNLVSTATFAFFFRAVTFRHEDTTKPSRQLSDTPSSGFAHNSTQSLAAPIPSPLLGINSTVPSTASRLQFIRTSASNKTYQLSIYLMMLCIVGAATSVGIYVCGFVSNATQEPAHDIAAGIFFAGSLVTALALGVGVHLFHHWSRLGRFSYFICLFVAIFGICLFLASPSESSERSIGEYTAVLGVVACIASLGFSPLRNYSFHILLVPESKTSAVHKA